MNWVTTLPMYNVAPAPATDWRTFLERVRHRLHPWLASRGDTLSIIYAEMDLQELWLSDDLLLSQTCGYPLVHALAGRVQYIATPAFDIPGCKASNYHSILVTSQPGIQSLEQCRGLRAAYNTDDSNSGMNLFRRAVAPLAGKQPFFASVLKTGSHLASLRALAVDRLADVAAIDCVTFAFVREHLPALANAVHTIGVTQPAPGLPLIASKQVPADGIAALVAALADVIGEDRALAARLKLKSFVRRPVEDYASILQIETDAAALGYPRLA
jgi:ABC-type phosphate/phosphonate transport system substrate-binding protein